MIVKTDEKNYQDIADAIRSKLGTDMTYLPSEMAGAIEGIKSGEGFDLDVENHREEVIADFNANLKACIEYSKTFFESKRDVVDWSSVASSNSRLVYLPFTPTARRYQSAFYMSGIRSIKNFDFSTCKRLTEADKVPSFYNAFYGLTLYDFPEYIDLKRCTEAYRMFGGSFLLNYPSKVTIDLGNQDDYDFDKEIAITQVFRDVTFAGEDGISLEFIGNRGVDLGSMFHIAKGKALKEFVYLNSENVKSVNSLFMAGISTEKLILGSLENCTDFNNFIGISTIPTIKFTRWKTSNISFGYAGTLLPSCINYIIEHALGEEDGATARTLTLHATAKANWMDTTQNPDYEYYQAMATEKLITIA